MVQPLNLFSLVLSKLSTSLIEGDFRSVHEVSAPTPSFRFHEERKVYVDECIGAAWPRPVSDDEGDDSRVLPSGFAATLVVVLEPRTIALALSDAKYALHLSSSR